MRRMLVSLPVAIAVLFALPPAASHAATQCGTLHEGYINEGDAISAVYVQVEVVRGSVSCVKARAVVNAFESTGGIGALPHGWHCTNAALSVGTALADECRKGNTRVYGINTYPPRPASTPGNFLNCTNVTSGIYTATSIDTTADSCVNARVVANEFINDPACAINFQSSSDYDCYESIGSRTYHCTGTIETARESSIECDYNNDGDGFTFDMDD